MALIINSSEPWRISSIAYQYLISISAYTNIFSQWKYQDKHES